MQANIPWYGMQISGKVEVIAFATRTTGLSGFYGMAQLLMSARRWSWMALSEIASERALCLSSM
jgi:hypothetical protein